jgi:hypothetical protein
MRYARQPGATLKLHSIRRSRRVLSVALCVTGLFAMGLCAGGVVFAGDEEDRAEIQKKLNQGVMEKPFSVEDTAKIDAYIKDAMQKDLKPNQEPPRSWRSGYTCANLHDYYEYRNCLYYYRYYGHYW